MAENKSEFDPRKYLGRTVDAMKKICIDRYEAFGCSGNASKIKSISLFDMTDKYKTGELDPVIN